MNNKSKIGVFDSGIGGVKIACAINDRASSSDIYYFADQAFSPYGDLSEKVILERCDYIVQTLLERGVEQVVVACNSATAVAIEHLRNRFNIPFVGVEPDLNFLKRNNISQHQRVGVLTTPVTPKMKKFQLLKAKRDPQGSFDYLVMPQLARLVEKLFYATDHEQSTIVNEIKDELNNQIKRTYDYLVLGCTHYGLIDQLIQDHLGIKTICPSKAVADRSISLLNHKDKESAKVGELFFQTSIGEVNNFKKLDLSWKERFKSENLMS